MRDGAGFVMPREGHAYVSQVFETADQLVRAGIWSGLDRDRLRIWRKNFTDSDEQYFAACCLDRLLYRSSEQTFALMRHLWTRKLPMLQRSLDGVLRRPWLESLQGNVDAGIRVVPVVDPKNVTKSGYVIARLLEKKLRVKSRYIKSLASVADNINTVIFVDDFVGGGTQFELLLKDAPQLDQRSATRVVYAPLVAHRQGIETICERLPGVHVVAAEHLDDSHRLLTDASDAFSDGVNTPALARVFYYAMLRKYGVSVMPSISGVPHLGVAYAFEHAAPNNSLEIFWASSSGGWRPLFDR